MGQEQLKILLTDDDKDDCLFFQKALAELQPSALFAMVHDGEQLMSYLSENIECLPDVLFLDINMPRKTGFECLCEIVENEKLKSIFVVMFSTSYPRDPYYEMDLINRLLKIGAHYFIRKPAGFAELKEAIQVALTMATTKLDKQHE